MPIRGVAPFVRRISPASYLRPNIRLVRTSPKDDGGNKAKQEPQPDEGSTATLVSSTAEDLLKQRFLHAQNKSAGSSLAVGGSGLPSEMPKVFRDRSTGVGQQPGVNKKDDAEKDSSSAADKLPSQEDPISAGFLPDTNFLPGPPFSSGTLMRTKRYHPSLYQPPFDTYKFVKRLEEGGWKSPRNAQDRSHDPSEAIMEASRALLCQKSSEVLRENMDKGDLENQLYFFSAALSELRTEVTMRARNDAAALRSLAALLQREVDGLEQKMQADVERLKHDIQVEMNHRKNETKGEQNNLEQEIQDLNNRFTIFLSDLGTEIEQSIKWDATRRALALVFGIVAILVCTLALADYLTKQEEEEPPRTRTRSHTPRPERRRERLPEDESSTEDIVPPKSAEEWGLLPRYDTDDGRYV